MFLIVVVRVQLGFQRAELQWLTENIYTPAFTLHYVQRIKTNINISKDVSATLVDDI